MEKFKTFEDMKNDTPEGATHYRDEDDKNLFTWVKIGESVEIWCDAFCQWKPAGAHVNLIMRKITPIKNQPKRTRTEYEKVTESIFDLRDEFERGELYCRHASTYSKCETWRELAHFMIENEVYRKVEKEIDWRQEFIERAKGLVDATKGADYSLGKIYDAGCRFVGDNGEIE